ncbi:hypothetical protein DNL40_02445 [Xylanimonas oleitrophica]|uniref:Uncharacterized protein n=1 Tax=Xylanimonas oleitrophica TaxID=2607479 RepID=A0A2W5WVQ4_9MICO|nr:hypothetical protein [Xylanimonas oleitrophica]PZR55250.1 hypothetical protein DNL40_02445 [Xylanimonas oleitrophica]
MTTTQTTPVDDRTRRTREQAATIHVGDRIRFTGDPSTRWWTVRARDERFIIATRQAAFEPGGTLRYTVVDLTGWTHRYNGVGPGVVRSSLNTLGGGWDLGPEGEGCDEILAELQAGRFELSVRRVLHVDGITRKEAGPMITTTAVVEVTEDVPA